MSLAYFSVDHQRHELVVDVEFYQMNLTSVVEIARRAEPDSFINEGVFLPSWSKFVADPARAKGFFTNVLQAVFEGKGGDDSLNVDFQTGRKAKEGMKVAMMFLPGSTTNVKLKEYIKPFAEQALSGFKIVVVSGAEDNMTNATAERLVLDAIETAAKNNQHVLILSAGMAQRSFSVPQITELYLAYDSGDNGATIQKMSRTFTPHKVGKIGRVISLSFDPNRDDKFDAMLIETAQNYMKNKGTPDLKTALRTVIRTVDIFVCQPDGAVKMDPDDYLKGALARNSIDRVIGKVAKLDDLSPDMIRAIAQGKAEVFQAAKKEATQRGKTKLPAEKLKRGANVVDISAKDIAKAREVIVTIAQNIDLIRWYSGKNGSIQESFAQMDVEGKPVQDEVAGEFGIEYELIKELVMGGVINRGLIELKFA